MKKLFNDNCNIFCNIVQVGSPFLFTGILLLVGLNIYAQQANIPTNSLNSTALVNNSVPAFTVNAPTTSVSPPILLVATATWSGMGNVVDNNLGNFATLTTTLNGWGKLSVTDPDQTYDAGNYAGFLVDMGGLVGLNLATLLSGVTVRTYLGGTLQESISGASLVGLDLGTGAFEVGLITTKNYNRIEIEINPGVLSTVNVYHAVQRAYVAGSPPTCNVPTGLNLPVYPAVVDPAKTGFGGLLNIGTIANANDAVSASTTDFASIAMTASLAGSANFAIKDQKTVYPAGTYAGFDLDNPTLLGVNLLGGITISTYKAGALRQAISGTNLLSVPTSLLTGSGRQKVGFVTTLDFDEVQITLNSVVGIGLLGTTTRIYSAVLESFCPGPVLVCNTSTTLTNGEGNFPVVVNGERTGVINSLACVGCGINNTDNIIDNDPNNYGSLNVTVAALGAGAQLSVQDVLDEFPAGTFTGFDIENSALVGANALSGITITTYNNGVLQESQTASTSLVAINTGLIAGSGRGIIGFVTSMPFDEIQISLAGLVSAQVGETKVYGAVVQKACAPVIECHRTYWLNNGNASPSFPVVIDASRTGFGGLASVGSTVANAWNALTPSITDFATITTTVGAIAPGSLAVLDAISFYPKGTYAGFAIEDVNGLVQANLLNSISVSTYLDGVLQETKSGSNLIDLKVLIPILGAGAGKYNIGFVASKDFDEIQLSVSPLVGAGLLDNVVNVYGAFIDTRTSSGAGSGGSLDCSFIINPDFDVTYVNVPVSGSVSTNDIVSGSSEVYGTAVPAPTNQAGATLTLAADGSYAFTGSTPGNYTYTVPVCTDGATQNCPTSPLVITVLDANIGTNPPVANTDLGTVLAGNSITLNTLTNDNCSNAGCTLSPTSVSISVTPTHGTASVNATTGNITYTPNAGFDGTDSLTYTVCDNQTPTPKCATAKQYFTIYPATHKNTTVASDDYEIISSNSIATGNVKINDSDPEGNAQIITAKTIVLPQGTLSLDNSGNYTFIPVSDFSGPVSFIYTTCDNATPQFCANATLHILVQEPVPNGTLPPVAEDDFTLAYFNTSVNGNVKTNDYDPQGSPLTYNTILPVSPVNGTVSNFDPLTGDFTYTPNTDYMGVDSFKYSVCNMLGVCSDAWVNIGIYGIVLSENGMSQPPIAMDDRSVTKKNAPVASNASSNDIDESGSVSYSLEQNPGNGVLIMQADGKYTYTPDAEFVGLDTAKYVVCNVMYGLCSSAEIIVEVLDDNTPGADRPRANDDLKITNDNRPVSGNVFDNDTDPNNLPLTATLLDTAINGTITFNSDGSFTFIPNIKFTGTETFVYAACNTNGLCDTASLIILSGPSGRPDLAPNINIRPLIFYGTTNFNAIINVFEVNNVDANGTDVPIKVKLSKDILFNYAFDPTAVSVGGIAVNNASFTFDAISDPNFYIFTTTATVPASEYLAVGLTGVFTAPTQKGKAIVKTIVVPGSGGENVIDNNTNSVTLTYFPN